MEISLRDAGFRSWDQTSQLDAIDQSQKAVITDVKLQGLRLAADASFWLKGSDPVVMQIGKLVTGAGLLVAENLAVDIQLGTAFVDANIRMISPVKQTIYPVNSGPATMKGTEN